MKWGHVWCDLNLLNHQGQGRSDENTDLFFTLIGSKWTLIVLWQKKNNNKKGRKKKIKEIFFKQKILSLWEGILSNKPNLDLSFEINITW